MHSSRLFFNSSLSLLISGLLLSGLWACQTPTDAVNPNNPAKPEQPTTTPVQSGVVYDKGTPIGQPVQKAIGPEGGTITSADGALSMTVPAGAVSKTTTFSVQPVTPTLPNLLGRQAYRLLPEGQTFAQAVTLRFQYQADSLDGTSAQLLFMAYQGNDGYWKALPDTELDETAHTLTVRTKHFSDWGAFAEFVLKSNVDVLAPGESTQLKLLGFTHLPSDLSNEDIDIALGRVAFLEDPKNIKNWQVKGKGNLTVENSQTVATYFAPENAAGSSAIISVDVYNFIPTNRRPRPGASGKAVILKKIRVEGTYFEATIDGKTYEFMPFALADRHGIQFWGSYSSGKSFTVQIRSGSIKPLSTIPYGVPSGELDGNAVVSITDGSPWPWLTWAPTCGVDYLKSEGGIHIDSYELVNGKYYVRGSLTATVYGSPDNCLNIQSKKVSAKFNFPFTEL
ncbi:hypothetical protein GCM10028805_13760 [Spirosoma harenae]